GAAHLSAADGVVAHESDSGVSDHPVRSNKEASRHFLFVASTPPHEEGTKFVKKIFLEKTSNVCGLSDLPGAIPFHPAQTLTTSAGPVVPHAAHLVPAGHLVREPPRAGRPSQRDMPATVTNRP